MSDVDEDVSPPPAPPGWGAGAPRPDAERDAGDGPGEPVSGRERRARWRATERARRREARRSVRYPIFTRSILLWMLVFALTGIAFGASGAFWWANFDSQVSDLRNDTQAFEERSAEAQAQIDAQRAASLAQIDEALSPLQGFLSESQMVQLASTYAPSLVAVATLDEAGRPSVATGFAVISTEAETFYVTSYSAVRAATVQPGPPVTARRDGQEVAADVWNWDEGRDLALLRVAGGGVPLIEWAGEEVMAQALGTRVFPVSAVGGAGAALTTGMVIDLQAAGIQHTAALGTAFRGAPIVDVDGHVVAVASLDYRPLGYDPGAQIHFAPPVGDVCQGLIACGDARSAAPRRG